jgi:hypothetical protein
MGLRQGDLKDMIYRIFEIDSYASKMGDDKDIVTLSFSVKEKEAADDLMNFIEKGYDFVLDADVTPGEQSDGTYKVFVELERTRQIYTQIDEIIDGIKKLSDLEKIKFRYYKNFRSMPYDLDMLKAQVPSDPADYGIKVTESNLDNYKNFFNQSSLESIEMLDDVITIKKKWADPLVFEFVDFGDAGITKQITETFDIMNSYPEILFLTKYLGDYNICKYGNKFVFENAESTLVLKRL